MLKLQCYLQETKILLIISLKAKKSSSRKNRNITGRVKKFVDVLKRAQNFISWASFKFNAMEIDPTPADSLPLACALFQTNDMGHNYS